MENIYHVNPVQWNQAVGLAQTMCHNIGKRGGNPADAVQSYALNKDIEPPTEWDKAEQIIALSICAPANQRPS